MLNRLLSYDERVKVDDKVCSIFDRLQYWDRLVYSRNPSASSQEVDDSHLDIYDDVELMANALAMAGKVFSELLPQLLSEVPRLDPRTKALLEYVHLAVEKGLKRKDYEEKQNA